MDQVSRFVCIGRCSSLGKLKKVFIIEFKYYSVHTKSNSKDEENCCKSREYIKTAVRSVKQKDKKHHNTHGHSRQQSFRHVGHNDADEEDDSFQPGVAQDEGQDEEGHSEEDRHSRDQVDKVLDFDVDGRAADFELRCQGGDPAHHCPVTRGYDDAAGCAWVEGRGAARLQYLFSHG